MSRMDWINLAYLVAALGFAFSLKWMTSPQTARDASISRSASQPTNRRYGTAAGNRCP